MKKILIVDDDPGIQDAFRAIFDAGRYQLNVFADGDAVLANNFEVPDLFILDKQLAGVDGIDLCRIIKGRPATRDVPVIIISASPAIEKLALAAGADEVLEKPFSINVLREMVLKHVEK
jgi:CheY-like chemotaxis protein